MMRALVPLVVALTASVAAAQPAQPTPATVLANVQKTYATAKDVSADFAQTVTNTTFGKTSTTSGKLFLSKPKFRWDYVNAKSAPLRTFLYDSVDLWIIDHGNKQVIQEKVAQSSLPAVVAFWTGSGSLAKDFNVALAKPGTYGAAGSTVLELTPKQPSAAFTKVFFVVDPKTSTITQSVVINSNGDTNSFTFTNVDTNAGLKPTLFQFNMKSVPTYKLVKPAAQAPPAPPAAPAKPSSVPPAAKAAQAPVQKRDVGDFPTKDPVLHSPQR